MLTLCCETQTSNFSRKQGPKLEMECTNCIFDQGISPFHWQISFFYWYNLLKSKVYAISKADRAVLFKSSLLCLVTDDVLL